jgi:hypothetical protein
MMWLYVLGVYLGIGILTSLSMPADKNLHGELIGENPAWLRVLAGFVWPLYYVLRIYNRRS